MPWGYPTPPQPTTGRRVKRWFAGQVAEVKASLGGGMRFPTYGTSGAQWWSSPHRLADIDYAIEVGDGSDNSIVTAVVRWMMRTYPEAPLGVRRMVDGEATPFPEHPLIDLWREPNPHYAGTPLTSAMVRDYAIDGNTYILKERGDMNRPARLWWIPYYQIEPKWPQGDGTVFISHYEYRPGGGAVYEVPPEDIIHIRDGIDPSNTRKGISGLKALLREVFTDEEAARFTGAILRNMGIPGVIISPQDKDNSIGEEDAAIIEQRYMDKTTGSLRGRPIILSTPGTVEQFGFSPEQLDLRALRTIPEERISGVFGVPAIVAGLGAGLQRSTFANYHEAREAAYEENIIPMQRVIAEQLRAQLLSEYLDDLRGWDVYYEYKDVRVLQEDQNSKSTRIGQQVRDGIVTVATGQRELGYDADDAADYYLRPINIVTVPKGAPLEAGTDGTPTVDPVVGSEIQSLALNGAQISSLLDVLNQVSTGIITAAAASEILTVAFPAISQEQIARLVATSAASPGAPAPTPDQVGS